MRLNRAQGLISNVLITVTSSPLSLAWWSILEEPKALFIGCVWSLQLSPCWKESWKYGIALQERKGSGEKLRERSSPEVEIRLLEAKLQPQLPSHSCHLALQTVTLHPCFICWNQCPRKPNASVSSRAYRHSNLSQWGRAPSKQLRSPSLHSRNPHHAVSRGLLQGATTGCGGGRQYQHVQKKLDPEMDPESRGTL